MSLMMCDLGGRRRKGGLEGEKPAVPGGRSELPTKRGGRAAASSMMPMIGSHRLRHAPGLAAAAEQQPGRAQRAERHHRAGLRDRCRPRDSATGWKMEKKGAACRPPPTSRSGRALEAAAQGQAAGPQREQGQVAGRFRHRGDGGGVDHGFAGGDAKRRATHGVEILRVRDIV